MRGLAMLDYRHGAPHGAVEFKVTEHDQRVCQIADVYRRLYSGADETVLRHGENGYYAPGGKVAQKLMHLHHKKAIIGHCIQVAIEAVNDHHADSCFLYIPL